MEKLDALKDATKLIYRTVDFGEFGGCGDVVSVLRRMAELLTIRGVQVEHGYMDLSKREGEQDIAHAWLLVDGERFDPSAWYHHFEPIRYDPVDQAHPERYQSDLLECIIGLDEDEIEWLARMAADYVQGRS